MNIRYGNEKTEYGPGVLVELSGDEIALAIDAFLVAHGVRVSGARTVTVNGAIPKGGSVYVDPSGFVITPSGGKICGRGSPLGLETPAT